MKLLIVAALMFLPVSISFATLIWSKWFRYREESDLAESMFKMGIICTLALYGILYLIFGE